MLASSFIYLGSKSFSYYTLMSEADESSQTPELSEDQEDEQIAPLTTQSETAILKRDNGIFKFPNGDLYAGWFAVNTISGTIVRQGLGKYFVADGGYYEGRWFDDRLQKGKIKFSNGSYYVGNLNENHQPTKRGMYFLPKRGWLIANFVKGQAKSNIRFWDVLNNEWVGSPCPYMPGKIVFSLKNPFLDEFSVSRALKLWDTEKMLKKFSGDKEPVELSTQTVQFKTRRSQSLLAIYQQFSYVSKTGEMTVNDKKGSRQRNGKKGRDRFKKTTPSDERGKKTFSDSDSS